METSPLDSHIASDTSNKENSCLLDVLSDEEMDEDLKKPQVCFFLFGRPLTELMAVFRAIFLNTAKYCK